MVARGLTTLIAAGIVLAVAPVSADTVLLKASHQFPGGRGDPRDEMVQIIAREVAKAEVGVKIEVHPDAKLHRPTAQWGALTRGELDLSAFPLDYASDRHPQFSVTLMPGLVRNYDR